MAKKNLTLTIKSKVYGRRAAMIAARAAALCGAAEGTAIAIGKIFIVVRMEVGQHKRWVWLGCYGH